MDLTTAARILEAKRPRYFIFENVPGLLGIEKGQTFKVILETLSELGYCVEWLVYPKGTSFGRRQRRLRRPAVEKTSVPCRMSWSRLFRKNTGFRKLRRGK